ncbi:hypothetical protein B0H15DRAFT_778626, partial [Mycena belliarum]
KLTESRIFTNAASSIPLDDLRAHSFNREHGPARAGSRGRLVFCCLCSQEPCGRRPASRAFV